MSKKLIVRIANGLGNQLFQISTVLAHAKDTGLKPVFGDWKADLDEFCEKKNPQLIKKIILYFIKNLLFIQSQLQNLKSGD